MDSLICERKKDISNKYSIFLEILFMDFRFFRIYMLEQLKNFFLLIN